MQSSKNLQLSILSNFDRAKKLTAGYYIFLKMTQILRALETVSSGLRREPQRLSERQGDGKELAEWECHVTLVTGLSGSLANRLHTGFSPNELLALLCFVSMSPILSNNSSRTEAIRLLRVSYNLQAYHVLIPIANYSFQSDGFCQLILTFYSNRLLQTQQNSRVRNHNYYIAYP